MSRAHAKLYAVKRQCNVDDDAFKAILLGQIGRESAKGISWSGVEACVKVMERDYLPRDKKPQNQDPDWRPRAKSAHARKIYVLWGILKRAGVVKERFPDGFVKRLTDRERAEWLVPSQANKVIEGLTDWIKREGLDDELR